MTWSASTRTEANSRFHALVCRPCWTALPTLAKQASTRVLAALNGDGSDHADGGKDVLDHFRGAGQAVVMAGSPFVAGEAADPAVRATDDEGSAGRPCSARHNAPSEPLARPPPNLDWPVRGPSGGGLAGDQVARQGVVAIDF